MSNPLQDLLNQAGLSQREAAIRFGISQQTMNRWCSDDAPSNVIKLVKLLIELLS